MGQYTSYWMYQRFEQRGSQDPIPVYPNTYSIDGDGTMPLVVRKDDDEQCGYIPPVEPIYRWTNIPITQDYICDDCSVAQYRWVNLDPSVDYYCEDTTKYYKQKKQVSYDNGVTWQDVTPPEYQKGGVAEEQSTDCGYVPPTPYESQYFTVSAIGNVTFGFKTKNNQTYQYTLDGGSTWTTGNSATSVSLSSGQKMMIKGNLIPSTDVISGNLGIGSLNIGYVYPSYGGYDLEGNVMSLLFGDDFIGKTDLTGKDYAFYYLIGYTTNTLLKNVNNLILPATTLSKNCYERMFEACASITTSPTLPATTLSEGCYDNMFAGCTSLSTAPELPATTLTESCYAGMFRECSSLTAAPQLPATTLADFCYSDMFAGCTSLTVAPQLPATTLAARCYSYMFARCTNLTVAPQLPATTLAKVSYQGMFYGCTSLTVAPELPSTTLTINCYEYMFVGCTSLSTAPELPATTLSKDCYNSMFSGCTSLTTAPNISATTLQRGTTGHCYNMFAGCTSLETAPELKADTLRGSSYRGMFSGCTSLNYVKCLATNKSASNCTYNWLSGVSSTGTFVKKAGVTWSSGTSGIPNDWTVIET